MCLCVCTELKPRASDVYASTGKKQTIFFFCNLVCSCIIFENFKTLRNKGTLCFQRVFEAQKKAKEF